MFITFIAFFFCFLNFYPVSAEILPFLSRPARPSRNIPSSDIINSHESSPSSPSILGLPEVRHVHDTGIIHAHSFGADHKYIARFK